MLEAYILGALWELISKSFQNCEASAYSLHAIYFLAMYSVEAEARIPLWHPKRMCWRQWINGLLQFQSHKAPWTAPTTPALSALRGSVPTDGAAALNSADWLRAVAGAGTVTVTAPGQCWHGPGSWLPSRGDTFLCVPAHSVLMVMFKPRIVSFLPVCQLWKKKGLF